MHVGDGEIRYVGKTHQALNKRLRGYRSSAKLYPYRPLSQWVVKNGHDIEMTVLEVCTPNNWREREAFWIQHYASLDITFNILLGAGRTHYPSFPPEHREKIGAAFRTGDFYACHWCGGPMWVLPSRREKKFCSRKCKDLSGRGVKTNRPFSIQAIEAAAKLRRGRTHCKRGHLLSGDNLRISKLGSRICKICQAEKVAEYRARQKAAGTYVEHRVKKRLAAQALAERVDAAVSNG